MMELDLQLFAKDGPGGEKTEQPTSKKLQDARKEGQVAKSKEIGNALGLLTLFLILKLFMGYIGNHFVYIFKSVYTKIPEVAIMYGGNIPKATITDIFVKSILEMVIVLAPFLGIGLVVAVLGELAQVKWQISTKPLVPKLSKLNPINGFKKLFDPKSLVELLKSFLKIALIVYVVYSTLKEDYNKILIVMDMPLWQAVSMVGSMAIDLGLRYFLPLTNKAVNNVFAPLVKVTPLVTKNNTAICHSLKLLLFFIFSPAIYKVIVSRKREITK